MSNGQVSDFRPRWWRVEAPSEFVRRFPQNLKTIAGATAVTGACMIVVRNGTVSEIERAAFRAINQLPDGVRAPMWTMQLFGSLAFVGSVAAAALLRRRTRLGVALTAAVPIKLAVEWWLIKAIVERERPSFTVPDAVIREASSSPLGFPSGHAILAFALAGLLAPYLSRRGKYGVYLLATANSVARIYLGAHNPLDVIAGASVGIAIAAGLNLVVGQPEPKPAESQAGH